MTPAGRPRSLNPLRPYLALLLVGGLVFVLIKANGGGDSTPAATTASPSPTVAEASFAPIMLDVIGAPGSYGTDKVAQESSLPLPGGKKPDCGRLVNDTDGRQSWHEDVSVMVKSHTLDITLTVIGYTGPGTYQTHSTSGTFAVVEVTDRLTSKTYDSMGIDAAVTVGADGKTAALQMVGVEGTTHPAAESFTLDGSITC